MQLTIKVQFPNGEREVPAYEKMIIEYSGMGHATPNYHQVLTPEPMDGWIFAYEIDGTWKAYEDN